MERKKAVIVGSGFAGLCMAIKLREAGIHDFVLLEKSDSVGGTWRDNHYPGCACDVPSHLYSYSFTKPYDWSRKYAPAPEIRAYLEGVATDYGLRPHLVFGAELIHAEHDGERWSVRTKDGRAWSAELLILGVGGLSRPALPAIEGLEHFEGPSFHSAAWRHDVPLEGRRVGVIGTGASAIQLVPPVAAAAGSLALFQRTPPWIVPKTDRAFTAWERRALQHPAVARLYRAFIYGAQEYRAIAFLGGPRIQRLAERVARKHLEAQVPDPVLRARVTPSYRMGCKRILISNDYYPALARPNVELVTDPIARVEPQGVVTQDGKLRPLDVLIYSTGFAVHDYVGPAVIKNAKGQDLGALWKKGAEAYLGVTVAGFPNLFMLVGPNTGLGHNSIVFMIESQLSYVMGALRHMQARGIQTLELKPEVQARYNEEIAQRLDHTVWATGCQSWYQDARGRNTVLWPGTTLEFRSRTRRFDPESYLSKEARA